MTILNNNNFVGKRTSAQVKSVLVAFGINCRIENSGDGRTFCLFTRDTVDTRIKLKKAGFITERSAGSALTIYIKAY